MCEPGATITGLCAKGHDLMDQNVNQVVFILFSEIKVISHLLLLSAFSAHGMCQSLTTLTLRKKLKSF